ncbi:prepilin-type N-terminal cleavage/methylation domain-containing protein [Bacillus coreaensis]
MRNEKGVTLIELLIVILIMVSISALAFSLFSYGTNMERTVAKENELQREARFIMETISNTVRDGQEISSKIVYSNGEIKLVSGPVLSKNVKSYTVTEQLVEGGTKKRYKVILILEKDGHEYKVSTEVFNDAQKRVRY